MSPAGVDNVIVPTIDRDFSFSSAARPPIAVTHLLTTSSAVCAPATWEQPSITKPAASNLERALIISSPLAFRHLTAYFVIGYRGPDGAARGWNAGKGIGVGA